MRTKLIFSNQGKLDGLVVCKPNDRDLLRNFESALRFGKPILLENVGQELDPALDPVLKVKKPSGMYHKVVGSNPCRARMVFAIKCM